MMPTTQETKLEELVGHFGPGGSYGIEWAHEGGALKLKARFDAPWWTEGVEQGGLEGFYTADSAGYTFEPGQGLVGKAFASGTAVFAKDLQTPDAEGVMDALNGLDMGAFVRAE